MNGSKKFVAEFIFCGIHIHSDYNLFFVGTLSNSSALLALRTKDALPMYVHYTVGRLRYA